MNLDDKQLQKIDKLIESFNDFKNFDATWNNFSSFIVSCLKIECTKGNFIKCLFIENIPFTEKKFISFCLLRIYSLNPKFITNDKSVQLSIFKHFDNTVLDVYKQCGIKTNSQGYEKESQLSDYISNIDKEIASQLAISSLKEVNTYEYKYKKTLSENKYHELFNFFSGGLDSDSLITRIFKAIQTYISSATLNKLSAYELALKEIDTLLARSVEINTKYTRLLFEKPFTTIRKLIDEDFANSPISKPANLSVKLTGKKYPFLNPSEIFAIDFEIINSGEGFAYDTKLKIIDYNSEIKLINTELDLGLINTDRSVRNLDCQVIKGEELAFINLSISWKDFDGNSKTKEFQFELESQIAKNWEQLKLKQPYSLKPVENEDDLIGRTEKLNELIALCRSSDSCFVTGQKRVGKTSLVRILKEKISRDSSMKNIVVYVSLQLAPTVINTIDVLAERICEEIKLSDERVEHLEIPVINHSLGSIYYFLMKTLRILSDYKITIIIDEFDQLPLELYRRGDIGDSFFNALKNLSTESKISFILVGGEKMSFIKNVQAIHLNLFKSFSLDYFDAENSWSDFEELVRHPVKNDLEIDSSAIQYLYTYTLGHPYFTKKICQELYTICVNKHDSHVTNQEMKKSVSKAISLSEVNDFAHFWDDGIMEKGDKEEEISVTRRKVFLSLIDTEENQGKFFNSKYVEDVPQSMYEGIINEFIIRQIIEKPNGHVLFRVKFFYEWLKNFGIQKIFTTPADEKSITERKKIEALAAVTSQEILELLNFWGTYNGREITTDKVRIWLNQFGFNPIVHRLMFKILQGILFYDNNQIRINSKDIYKSIIRKFAQEGHERILETSKRKRNDIIVSYLESSFAKSGAEYAKIFADENSIYSDYAVSKSKLREYLSVETNIKALIFVDDFAGTGDSVCKNLKEIHENIGDLIEKKNLVVFLGIICGFDKAKSKIENFITHFPYKVEVVFSKILDESDKCFSDFSKVFPLTAERNHAKSICLEIGDNLVQRNPLGFGDCQSLVVFPNACPNNTLPILWQQTSTWIPLFKRS